MTTDYIDALREVELIAPGIKNERQIDFNNLDNSNDDEIWEYIMRWIAPRHAIKTILCKLGIHKYLGYNKYIMLDCLCSRFYGVCVRCGELRKSKIHEA